MRENITLILLFFLSEYVAMYCKGEYSGEGGQSGHVPPPPSLNAEYAPGTVAHINTKLYYPSSNIQLILNCIQY